VLASILDPTLALRYVQSDTTYSNLVCKTVEVIQLPSSIHSDAMRILPLVLSLVWLGLPGCYLVHRPPGTGDGTDASTLLVDASSPVDTGPGACSIAGTYRTNGGVVMTLALAPDGTYSADGGRFVGTYTWNGTVLAFAPGPGSTSTDCASQLLSSVSVTFDRACRQALVVVLTDNCTGLGILSMSSNITRQ